MMSVQVSTHPLLLAPKWIRIRERNRSGLGIGEDIAPMDPDCLHSGLSLLLPMRATPPLHDT